MKTPTRQSVSRRRGPLWPVALAAIVILAGTACDDGKRGRGEADRGETTEAGVDDEPPLADKHFRAVWVRDLGDSADTWLEGQSHRLMAYDSRDGRGERVLIEGPESVVRPVIAPNGGEVIFSKKDPSSTEDAMRFTVRVIDWEGGDARDLADGYATDAWADPDTGRVWVIAARELYYRFTKSGRRVVRFALDDPSEEVEIWNGPDVDVDNLQVTRSGRFMAGLFPWPYSGLADLEQGTWEPGDRGCWPSIAPDDSGVWWLFEGPHRSVEVTVAGGEEHMLRINDAPGVDGYEVYHPRWSNHVRYFACTGPYVLGDGRAARVHYGGPQVEILLGKFDLRLSRVTEWLQLTNNESGDFYPDLWFADGDESALDPTVLGAPEKRREVTMPPLGERWPGSREGLVFLWEDARSRNEAVWVVDGVEETQHFQVEARGDARFGRFGDMEVRGAGHFEVWPTVGEYLAGRARVTNEITYELTATPDVVTAERGGRILSLSNDAFVTNFALLQEGNQFLSRVKTLTTRNEGGNLEVGIGPIEAREQPYHIVVSCRLGVLQAWVNGVMVESRRGSYSGLGSWTPERLIFGSGWQGDEAWSGKIEGVAIYDRAMGEEEARHHYELYQERIEARRPVPRIVARGRLVEATEIPEPEALAPYRRYLAAHTYDIEEVLEGELPASRIAVFHYVILDQEKVTGYPRLVDQTYELVIEPMESHPQLQGESRGEAEDLLLPVYYDVSPPAPVEP